MSGFNVMPIDQGLFYVNMLGNCIHYTFIVTFFVFLFWIVDFFLHLVLLKNNVEKDLFDLSIGFKQVLSLRDWIELGIMSMKRYSTLFRFPELEPHHRMQFRVIPRILLFYEGVRVLPPAGNTVSLF